jgi:ketosteroid isomerase-like protein
MKKVVLCSLIGLVLLATAGLSYAQKNAATEKAVADLEHQWLKSQQTNDVKLVEPLLAEGFVNTDRDGKVENRTESIAEAKATHYGAVDYVDLKVFAFGDTAIAIGIFRGKVTLPDGKTEDQNERFTDTWAKMPSGKWQCVASHQSSIKM